MALCIAAQATALGGPQSAMSVPDAYTQVLWSVATATKTGSDYACPTGTHLLLTVEEVNAGPPSGIEPSDIASAYAWGLGAVLVVWSVGWVLGVIVGMIRKA